MTNAIIHNVETGEVIERPLTVEELQEKELLAAAIAKEKSDIATAKLAKNALLEKLGITEDEAKLLLS